MDDGAVFYLNGVEIDRWNMPAGEVTYSTLASSSVVDAEYGGFRLVSAASLVQGTNVLAVEVHQATVDDPDVYFGTELSATIWPAAWQQSNVKLALNELAAAGADSFWLELTNPGSESIPLEGLRIVSSIG